MKNLKLFFLGFLILMASCKGSSETTTLTDEPSTDEVASDDTADDSTSETPETEEEPVVEPEYYLYQAHSEVDVDGDGVMDVYETTTYNTDGEPLKSESDDNQDGVIEDWQEYEYDEVGCLVRHTYDGSFIVADYFYACDENLNTIEEIRDSGRDGVYESVTVRAYNSQGHFLMEVRDQNADGSWDFRSIKSYDITGELETGFDLDNDGDGIWDYRSYQSYDANDFLVGVMTDSDGDGVVNSSATYTRDGEGRTLEMKSDYDNDGVANAVTQYEYNAEGNKIGEKRDLNQDGVFEEVYTYTYTESTWSNAEFEIEVGDPVMTEIVLVDDLGVLLFKGNYIYSEDGREVSYDVDSDGNGVVDSREYYKYDDRGNRIEYFSDSDLTTPAYDYHELIENIYKVVS